MKDDHLTLRLPGELARTLARWARERGESKSNLVREAVARYLAAPSPDREPSRTVTAADLAARWPGLPRLSPSEASDLAADLARARRDLPPVRELWE